MRIIFITGNKGKAREARGFLEPLDYEVVQENTGYPELQSDKLEDIASYGARYAADKLGETVIVEDSGLFVEALGGFPGPYSSYVFKTLGNQGILKLMNGVDDREAMFQSVIGYCEPDGEPLTFRGEVTGRISQVERGEEGFGYDPIFEYEGKTFAEMSLEEKNRVSHRRRAMESLTRFLE